MGKPGQKKMKTDRVVLTPLPSVLGMMVGASSSESLNEIEATASGEPNEMVPTHRNRVRASLTLVPTPIGNLDDITLRALHVLNQVDVILAEDTRTSGALLKHHGIKRPLQSYHIHNEHKAHDHLVERMLKGEKMALVSDAGTPAISDPGFLLVRAALQAGLEVDCLPGATAFVPALVRSGLPTDQFVFWGFLPSKKGKQTALKEILEHEVTTVFYESPHRLLKTLEDLVVLGASGRHISVSRELTKMFEETYTGTVQEVLEYYTAKGVKGELVVVLSGKPKGNKAAELED